MSTTGNIKTTHVPPPQYAPFTVKGGLKVDEAIFTQGFVTYCDIDKCSGGCCNSGVYLDTYARDLILEHKDEIASVMDDTQSTDVSGWFDGEWIEDEDFPSGRATGTQVHSRDGQLSGFDTGCVFMDKRHFCTIQVAAAAKGLHRWAWKPIYCILFPVTVVEGVLTYDDSHSEDLHHCGPKGAGQYVHSIFEATQEELRFFLGDDDFQKLFEYFEANRERFEAERRRTTLVQIELGNRLR